MSNFVFTNFAATTLAASLSPSATSMSVSAGTGSLFASPIAGQTAALVIISASNPNVVEIVYASARSGDTFTITRAQEGTTAGSWNVNDLVQCRVTAAPLNLMTNGHGFAVFTSNGTFQVPANVNEMMITACGGGGGGGGSAGGTTPVGGDTNMTSPGGAGAPGESIFSQSYTVTPLGTITINIGSGGPGGPGGSANQGVGGNGTAGGNTTASGAGLSITLNGGVAGGGGQTALVITPSSGVVVAGSGTNGYTSVPSQVGVIANNTSIIVNPIDLGEACFGSTLSPFSYGGGGNGAQSYTASLNRAGNPGSPGQPGIFILQW